MLVVNLSGSSASWERAAASPFCAAFLELSSYFNCAYFGLLLFNRAGERQDLQGDPAAPDPDDCQSLNYAS